MYSLLLNHLLMMGILALCMGCDSDEIFPVFQENPPCFSQTPFTKEPSYKDTPQNEEAQPVQPQNKTLEEKLAPLEETAPCEEDVRIAGELLQAHYNETQYMPTREDRIVILMTKMKINQKKAEAILDAMMLD